MNVQSIHNATFLNRLPPTYLAQARDLANYHEYNIFSDSSPTGIGNSAYFPFASPPNLRCSYLLRVGIA